MCLRTSSRDIVERNLMLNGGGVGTGAVAGEGLSTERATFDGCSSFGDTDSYVTDGMGAGACLAV